MGVDSSERPRERMAPSLRVDLREVCRAIYGRDPQQRSIRLVYFNLIVGIIAIGADSLKTVFLILGFSRAGMSKF